MLEATQTKQNSYSVSPRQQLHKYVSICVGCLLLVLATFPLACWRVSQSGKYNAGFFNSWTPEQNQKSEFDSDF